MTGASAPLGYRLETLLGRHGHYHQTWKAVDDSGAGCVLRIASCRVMSDDMQTSDLSGRLGALQPGLRELVALPPHPSVAPWNSFFVADDGAHVLRRPYYPQRLEERFPPRVTQDEAGGPRREFLECLAGVAAGIDQLRRLQPSLSLRIAPNNLFAAGERGVLADHGTAGLLEAVESGYDGPRPVAGDPYALWAGLAFDTPAPEPGLQDSQDFAAAYFDLRTGHPPFLSAPWRGRTFHAWFDELTRLASAYRTQGTLDASALALPNERTVIERALTRDVTRRFNSCTDVIRALMA